MSRIEHPDLNTPVDLEAEAFTRAPHPYIQLRAYFSAPGQVMADISWDSFIIVRGIGKTLGEALIQMGLAMTNKSLALTLMEQTEGSGILDSDGTP